LLANNKVLPKTIKSFPNRGRTFPKLSSAEVIDLVSDLKILALKRAAAAQAVHDAGYRRQIKLAWLFQTHSLTPYLDDC
jgi:hypothetical protein